MPESLCGLEGRMAKERGQGMIEKSLIKIDNIKIALAAITDIRDARKLLSIVEGLLVATRKEYKASERIGEVKEDRDKAYNVAVTAGELRLLTEARLGELLIQEQENGRLKEQGRPNKKGLNNVTFLKDIGLSKNDSYRVQRVAQYRDLIPQVIAEAIKHRDIPTKTALERLISKRVRREQREAWAIPPLHKELMPEGEGRRRRIERNQQERMWRICIGTNEAGVKLKEHLEEMKSRTDFIELQAKIDQTKNEAEELRKKAEMLEELAKDQTAFLKSELKDALEKQYGPAYTHAETIDFKINDEKTDEHIATLTSQEIFKFLLEPNENIEQCDYGFWGDIFDLDFSKTDISPKFYQRPSENFWAKIGWGDQRGSKA